MTSEPAAVPGPAVAGCRQDGTLWLYSEDRETCIFCGQAPDCILPFAGRVVTPSTRHLAMPEAPAEPPPPTVIGVTCPHCQANIQIEITDEVIAVVPLPVATAPEEAAAASQPNLQEKSTEGGEAPPEPLGVPAGVPAAASPAPRRRRS